MMPRIGRSWNLPVVLFSVHAEGHEVDTLPYAKPKRFSPGDVLSGIVYDGCRRVVGEHVWRPVNLCVERVGAA